MTRDELLSTALKAVAVENKDVTPFKIDQDDDGSAVIKIGDQEFMLMVIDTTE